MTIKPNLELFKGLSFYLEIFTNGEVADTYFSNAVTKHGGKHSRRLGKHITHLVWSEGKTQTLKKAIDLENIKIVSTLWFQETLDNMVLADEDKYRPTALDKILQKGLK